MSMKENSNTGAIADQSPQAYNYLKLLIILADTVGGKTGCLRKDTEGGNSAYGDVIEGDSTELT
jgi:hypothetical protein